MVNTEIMTPDEREVFEKLHIIRYEETLRDMQKARRERVLAECTEKECQEEIQLIQFQIAIAERYFKSEGGK